MNLEDNIKDVVRKKMGDGTVERLISEQLESGIKSALDNLFRSYGDATKVIEDQIESVIVPYLENYDYSKYITKLDGVLEEILKETTQDNKKLLKNFKGLMASSEVKEIKVTELFSKWINFVSKNVDTDDLDVDTDDEPTYEAVNVHFEIERNEERSWSCFDHAILVFECDQDEELNFEIPILRFTKSLNEGWSIDYKRISDIQSLRYLNEFEILLMSLHQQGTKLIIDSEEDEDEVIPEKRPKMTFE